MIVYKFGGASVKSAEGVRNIARIVSGVPGELFIVVSAMGKTTNALEEVLALFMTENRDEALSRLDEVISYHHEIIGELFEEKATVLSETDAVFDQLRRLILEGIGDDYDRWYDRLVSFGEVVSTKIISRFLIEKGINNSWMDMREVLVTDSNFREANINYKETEKRIKAAVAESNCQVYVGQGFIGTNMKGQPTTLGREGSDFTAAVVAYVLDAESVSIWKDVPGILNADPRIFPNTLLIPELSYLAAVELAYSGAQVIHPKTIKPLENKQIPLYVRPFSTPEKAGSIITGSAQPIEVPVIILKRDQVLITLRPLDFSFVLEESLTWIFTIVEKYRLKVSLIQSSAVSISICVDNSRYLQRAIDELSNDFRVSYNTDMELLTIRGTNPAVVEEATQGREVLVKQQTRRIARIVMKGEPAKVRTP